MSIPLSLPRPQTIKEKESDVGKEAIDSILTQEVDTDLLNQNFGLKAAVDQMHTLLAELSALSPTKAQSNVHEENKKIEEMRSQRKLRPAVEFSVPIFDDEDSLEETKPQQQNQREDDAADAQREIEMVCP